MIKKLIALFRKPEVQPVPEVDDNPIRRSAFSTEDWFDEPNQAEKMQELWDANFKNAIHPQIIKAQKASIAMDGNGTPVVAMDAGPGAGAFGWNGPIPYAQVMWYASKTFIGYQMCAMLAQQWLISKACLMPAKDAARNGYDITINNGEDVDCEILDAMREADVKYKINQNIIEFVNKGRVFGIRIALFLVDSDDEDYYKNPFNPDGVTPGSYRGISQVDPYWMTPQLDSEASANAASQHFYEPTWWIINGNQYHRTHLVIFRTEELPDILKPAYIYGGVSIPQKIAERVYAAERTANEAPLLALTKRCDVIKVNLAKAEAFPEKFMRRITKWVERRDNFGIKTVDLDDEVLQFDTSLTDLDEVIMTQFQLVAAAANVPSVKLMGTSPKGFNTTGEFEESNYHEELESIQTHDMSPLIERHHLLLIRSEIAPQFGIAPFHSTIHWNELDAMTAKEQAEVNKAKAETGKILIDAGAISPEDEMDRVINDPHSGYAGMDGDFEETESESVGA